jgi:hypothetical protein
MAERMAADSNVRLNSTKLTVVVGKTSQLEASLGRAVDQLNRFMAAPERLPDLQAQPSSSRDDPDENHQLALHPNRAAEEQRLRGVVQTANANIARNQHEITRLENAGLSLVAAHAAALAAEQRAYARYAHAKQQYENCKDF